MTGPGLTWLPLGRGPYPPTPSVPMSVCVLHAAFPGRSLLHVCGSRKYSRLLHTPRCLCPPGKYRVERWNQYFGLLGPNPGPTSSAGFFPWIWIPTLELCLERYLLGDEVGGYHIDLAYLDHKRLHFFLFSHIRKFRQQLGDVRTDGSTSLALSFMVPWWLLQPQPSEGREVRGEAGNQAFSFGSLSL